jgi:uncharacterized protein (DUF1501 family)
MSTRRAFLKGGGIALFSIGVGGAGPSFLERAAWAATPSRTSGRRKVLVTIFQRGAMDGLAAVSPFAERQLQKLRPGLALSGARRAGEESLIDLGVDFGLHPAFGAFEPLWRDGALGIVHAVGSPDSTRSHFDAQDYMETGTPGRKGTASGWLNRGCGKLGHEPTPFQAVSLSRALPRSLYGPAPALAVRSLADLAIQLPGAGGAAEVAGEGFEALYREASRDLLRGTAKESFEAVETVERLRQEGYRPSPGVDYPRGPLGASLQQIAMLVQADVGLEVAFAESGGWDTHVRQGAAGGSFAQRGADLADSIVAFWNDLGAHRDDVVVLTMTEFGRTVKENGSGGTDHGHGSCLFVLGNEIDGGKVHGEFPGLDPSVLYEGRDLPVTTDFRAVFSEVAGHHLGIEDDAAMFPDWQGGRLPLFKA